MAFLFINKERNAIGQRNISSIYCKKKEIIQIINFKDEINIKVSSQ